MTPLEAISYAVALLFWVFSGLYGLLAEQPFVVEQFLKPGLFPPLAIFAKFWGAWSALALICWAAPRWKTISRLDLRTGTTTGSWMAAIVTWAAVLAMFGDGLVRPLLWSALSVFMIAMLPAAEYGRISGAATRPASRASADFLACVVAAIVMVVIESAISAARGGTSAQITADTIASLRTQPLLAMIVFLVLMLIRATAAGFSAQVAAEARLVIIVLGVAFGCFIDRVVLGSISASLWMERIGAYVAGLAIATAISVGGLLRSDDKTDGIRTIAASFMPRVFATSWLALVWFLVIAALAIGLDRATQIADWNFALARTAAVVTWVCVFAAALRVVRITRERSPAACLGLAVAILIAHVALDRATPVAAMEPRPPASRWASSMLRPDAAGPSGFFDLLGANTNLTGDAGQPVNIEWSSLDGPPAALRPNIFMFVIDSLRRDYVSPYNPAVTFTPSIGAFAKDSLVFDRAFTQYGATGLSVPSIWIGGSLLHKQYVTPFAPMNALSKLIAHEQYAQWISMDNILDVILPRTPMLEPLDAGVPVKDFRWCGTLDQIRARLQSRAADGAPVFAYSLPQDIHVSTITREGTRSIDGEAYQGFYAPVASRIRRFDTCFGAFIDDLKAKGLFDDSVIIVTSDHGDSLGEGGRMGHAYTLYPEIVRVPLIIHVPAAWRQRWTWDPSRPAYTTDLTPTLYQLLGHEPKPPGDFYGEALARPVNSPAPPPHDRMVASSYGSVYGALLRNGTRLFVANAIERRELAFDIGEGAIPGRDVPVDAGTASEGTGLITTVVQSIARAYQVSPRTP